MPEPSRSARSRFDRDPVFATESTEIRPEVTERFLTNDLSENSVFSVSKDSFFHPYPWQSV